MIIAIKFSAYISVIQSWKWFLGLYDHLLNCFHFSGFYYDISYCPSLKCLKIRTEVLFQVAKWKSLSWDSWKGHMRSLQGYAISSKS